MRQGDTIFFETNDGPRKAKVASVLFSGTSRYVPDDTGEPWRELLIVETDTGNLALRDRNRVRSGDENVSSVPVWRFGDREAVVDWLSDRVVDSDGDDARLYGRALRALQKWAKAVAV